MSAPAAETTKTVPIPDVDPLSLFGKNDANLRLVERSYPVQPGPAEIVGYLRWPESPSWVVPERDASSDVWHVRNHRAMARARGWNNVAPFYIEQESPIPPGGSPHPASLRPNLPNHHLQYALTWYGLALVLIAVFAVWMVDRRRQTRGQTGPAV